EFLSQKLTGGTLIACGDTELRYAKKIGPALLVRNGIQQLGLTNFEKQHRPQIKCIGTLGRITYARNPAYFNQLALNHPELEFLWIGDGELRHQLTAPNITVTGWFNHYEQGLQKLEVLDLYLQTSLWEGLPIALLEASAREIPIVATNIIGNKDIVAAGKTGFLFDAEYEFDQILKKSKNQSTRIALGNAAKKRTAILFNSAVNFQKLIRLYQA
ncbi:MAG TPA: glycosyltransferase family 1 protein, partial [Leeuwenhoekiella sp.]|nr:glycosyltransferase family 1 protein [Leeuwenhoekiella sp.]